MRSIRRRLMLVLAVGFAVLIAVAGAVLAGVVAERAAGEFDAALLAQARALVALTEQEGGQIELDYDPAHMPQYERAERPDYFQFWLDDGQMLLRSRRLDADLPRGQAPPEEPRVRDVALPDGRRGRLVEIAYVPRGSPAEDDADAEPESIGTASGTRGLVLVVARGRERLDGLLAGVRWSILAVGACAALLAVLLVWRALAAGLRPVDAIAAEVRTLDAERLDARVQLPRTPQELAPIVDQLNALLDRLDAAFERERRFTANVAHELRTPIAELRALAEVGAKWPDDEAAVVRFFDDVTEVAGRMEGIIADLLLLARCQAGVERATREPVDLRDAVAAAAAKLERAAAERDLRLHVDVAAGLVAETDPGKLAIMLDNVLGNAVSYAKPGGAVRCRAVRQPGGFALAIENRAEPLEPEELGRLAEPFWRKDEARTAPGHAGLGLSVVCELGALLGLRVRFEQEPPDLFRVRLEGRAGATRRSPQPSDPALSPS